MVTIPRASSFVTDVIKSIRIRWVIRRNSTQLPFGLSCVELRRVALLYLKLMTIEKRLNGFLSQHKRSALQCMKQDWLTVIKYDKNCNLSYLMSSSRIPLLVSHYKEMTPSVNQRLLMRFELMNYICVVRYGIKHANIIIIKSIKQIDTQRLTRSITRFE